MRQAEIYFRTHALLIEKQLGQHHAGAIMAAKIENQVRKLALWQVSFALTEHKNYILLYVDLNSSEKVLFWSSFMYFYGVLFRCEVVCSHRRVQVL